jgi:hypothetical protein
MADSTSRLIGTTEAIERIGCDRSTLSRWVKFGDATPEMRLPGKTGAFLFSVAEVDRLAKQFAKEHTS